MAKVKTRGFNKSIFAQYGHECDLQAQFDVDEVRKFVKERGYIASIKRCLLRLIIVSETMKSYGHNLRSHGAIAKEQRRQLKFYPYRLHPLSKARITWEIFMMILIMIEIFAFTTDMSYYNRKYSPFFFTLEWMIFRWTLEIILCINLFVNLFTGYYDRERQEFVFEFRNIFMHYLYSRLWIDFITAIPVRWDAIFHFDHMSYVYFQVFASTKLLLIILFNDYFFKVTEFFQVSRHKYLASITIIQLLIFWHTLTCYLLFLRRATVDEDLRVFPTSDRETYGRDGNVKLYISGFYHAGLIFFTSSYGKMPPRGDIEYFFVCFVWLLSKLFTVYCLAQFMEIMRGLTSSKHKYVEMERQLKEYMRHKQLTPYMRRRILNYYEFRFQKRYFREAMIFNTISGPLRQEINMHSSKKLVENVIFFRNLPMNLLVRIISCLKIQVFLPNDVIIRANTVGKCMYFISTGTVAVYTKSGKEICHLEDGAHFGEVALLVKDTLRTASVVAIEVSEIYRLDQKDFDKAIYPYPDLLANIESIAADRLEIAMMLDEHNKGTSR